MITLPIRPLVWRRSQIVSNAMNDVNKSLSPAYVIVMSVSRLLIPLYVWGCPYNFMAVATIPGICIALVTYVHSVGLCVVLREKSCSHAIPVSLPYKFLFCFYKTGNFEFESPCFVFKLCC